jgi:hypothetical protein
MQNDGQLVVRDGSGDLVWTSREENGTSSTAQGWTHQITSSGQLQVSCITSGPSPAAVALLSQGKRFRLQVSQDGARLSLASANGSQVRRASPLPYSSRSLLPLARTQVLMQPSLT